MQFFSRTERRLTALTDNGGCNGELVYVCARVAHRVNSLRMPVTSIAIMMPTTISAFGGYTRMANGPNFRASKQTPNKLWYRRPTTGDVLIFCAEYTGHIMMGNNILAKTGPFRRVGHTDAVRVFVSKAAFPPEVYCDYVNPHSGRLHIISGAAHAGRYQTYLKIRIKRMAPRALLKRP